jgi:hypothetical protein
VIEDSLIVGVLTNTNQFVQIDPPSENIVYDGIPELKSSNFIVADKTVMTVKNGDRERIDMIRNIDLESHFYSTFRSLMRNLLNQYENREEKAVILKTVEDARIKYNDKLRKVESILREMADERVVFEEIAPQLLADYSKIACSQSTCEKEGNKFCIRKEDGICQMVIPNKHLISNVDNQRVYFGRLADELIRYGRVRIFIMQPKTFLNITDTDYKLNENEFIILQTTMNGDYFKNMKPYNNTKNIVNTNANNALPQISQVYANEPIPVGEQYTEEYIADSENLDELLIECIKKKGEVIGNAHESIWKRIFSRKLTEPAKEIVFKNINNNCSFFVLIYIFQNKYKKAISTSAVKLALSSAYKDYSVKYREQILSIWKRQGKKALVTKIKKKALTINAAILSEDYYLTDLDIWMFSKNARMQICLFSKNGLKSLNENLEWMIFGEQYNEKHYFIRSPTIVDNKPSSYSVVTPAYELSQLPEFEEMAKNIIYKRTAVTDNIVTLEKYLNNIDVQ